MTEAPKLFPTADNYQVLQFRAAVQDLAFEDASSDNPVGHRLLGTDRLVAMGPGIVSTAIREWVENPTAWYLNTPLREIIHPLEEEGKVVSPDFSGVKTPGDIRERWFHWAGDYGIDLTIPNPPIEPSLTLTGQGFPFHRRPHARFARVVRGVRRG